MNRLPRIGFVAYSLAPGLGGIPRVARLIERSLSRLAEAGELTFQSATHQAYQSGKGRLATRLAAVRLLIAQRRLSMRCSHFIYDSCQMAQIHGRPWPLAAPALTFVHGVEVWEQAKAKWLQACRNSRLLACNSNYTRQKADELHGDFARAQVCWLATESDQPPASLPRPTTPTVLIVSRVDREDAYKGHRELIRAWPEITRAVPTARLRIVGRGNGLEELKQSAANLPCRNNILFEGFVAEQQLESIYLESSVFAMPSRGEGFGIVYVEAMRCGLPVITSRQDAGQEVIVDGQTGYAVDLDDPSALTTRLIQLLGNPSQARAMGQAGQIRWQQYFTPDHFVQRFSPVILSLLNERAGRKH